MMENAFFSRKRVFIPFFVKGLVERWFKKQGHAWICCRVLGCVNILYLVF